MLYNLNMKTILKQIEAILEEPNKLSALCNLCALLFELIDDINWLGFYFYQDNELVLGPFQGKVACTHLSLDKGVCAKAFNENKLIIIPNVHKFPGHIACDSRTNSELVIPICKSKKKVGVLDIDSLSLNRFNKEDELLFSEIAVLISNYLSK